MKQTSNIRFEFVTKLSDSQFQEILDLVAHVYSKGNKFWQHLKVDFNESREFFQAYLSNCDVMTIAIDTNKNNKIVGGWLGVEVKNGDIGPFTNWKNTPSMEPYINMLKLVLKKADLNGIQKGKAYFGKTTFADPSYPKLGGVVLKKGYENLYLKGFESHVGFVSNPKLQNSKDQQDYQFYHYDYKQFDWNNNKPFKDMDGPPSIVLGKHLFEKKPGPKNSKLMPKL